MKGQTGINERCTECGDLHLKEELWETEEEDYSGSFSRFLCRDCWEFFTGDYWEQDDWGQPFKEEETK
jgi:hypothetical protein